MHVQYYIYICIYIYVYTSTYILYAYTNTYIYGVFAFNIPPNLPINSRFHHLFKCQLLHFFL